jgi:hypothetical protein
VSGGQLYTLEAVLTPQMCPVDGSPVPCSFEIRAQDIPAPYDADHTATLTITCDLSHCNTATNQWLIFKQTASGELENVLPCPLNVLGGLCFTAGQDAAGNPVVTVSNFKAGDPKIMGINIG